ncbi:NAD-dependent protein deacetylase [Solicola gregarius]|uniref:NAD-dependent protein deacetylase n=1 Tax=Solicola gregarius TaxID=2908642 RepID=A0AA46YN25_9ACTN|nr:NAD-dependent protein deacetylase [Solicola gregarius]UYM07046.1 NAD-dependent protein deacetylase [Solicola gregarius]
MLETTSPAEALRHARDVLDGRLLAVLTGAGISTDSGIPDYRGPDSPPRKPMTYQDFVSGPAAQRRYWARAHVGWGHMSAASPNAGHHALRRLERGGHLTGLITQNVDGLHEAAGHDRLIALHGRIADVVCLSCGARSRRSDLHERLARLNPGYAERDVEIAPDGDAVLDDVDGFVIAACEVCGGVLKPDVVFFGENVPRDRVAAAAQLVDAADALLVAGSSLQVLSGLRFVRQARKADKPIVIVNRGATRGDDLADVKVDAGTSETLAALERR